MNLVKLIFGIILLAIIPTHWFIGGLTMTTITGLPGLLFLGLTVVLGISGLTLIYRGITE